MYPRTVWNPDSPSLGCKAGPNGPEPILPVAIEHTIKACELAKHVAAELGLKEPLTIEFIKQTFAHAMVFETKQQDYGERNIADFRDYGCLVKMSDKVARLKNLYIKKLTPQHESVDDSFLDIANYGVIALMCRRGVWPK